MKHTESHQQGPSSSMNPSNLVSNGHSNGAESKSPLLPPPTLPPPQRRQRKQRQRKRKQQQQQQCRVCHRRASGHHYGALTCEACKAFFKRTVHSCLTYFCPVQRSGSRCPVKVPNKRQCPACRWKRCLEAHMQVRLVRSSSPVQQSAEHQQQEQQEQQKQSPSTIPKQQQQQSTSSSSRASAAAGGVVAREPPAYIVRLLAETADCETKAALAVAAASEAGLNREIVQQLRCTCSDHQVPDIDLSDASLAGITSQSERHAILLGICFNRLANDLVAFAKHLNGFAELPMPDRVQMLQVRWLNLVAWQIAYQSFPYDGHLKLCRNFWIREDAASLFAGRIPVRSGGLLRCLAGLLTRLGLTEAEFLLLKAAYLLEAPCSYQWIDRPAIDRLQERYLIELRAVCPSQSRRARLLSLDGLLEAIRVLTVGYWLRVMQRTPYTPPPLVTEMLTFSLANVPHVSSDLTNNEQQQQQQDSGASVSQDGVTEAIGSVEPVL